MSDREDSLASLRREVETLRRRLAEATAARAGRGPGLHEEELRASEERYRVLFESNPQPILVYSIGNLAILAANEAAVRHYGYSYEEFASLTINDVLAPEDAPAFLESLKSRPLSVTHVAQRRHLRKDGSAFDVEVTAYPLDFEGHKARLAVVSDVTERKRAEDALRQSERRFRALIENSSDAIALFGADGTILYGSAATGRLLGYALSDFVGRNAFELIHADDQPFVLECLNSSLRQPAVGVPVHAHVLHKDGSWRFLEGVFTNLLEDPSVGAIVNNYRDATQRAQVEAALRESESLLERAQSVAQVGSWVSGLEDRDRLSWSKETHRIFGVEESAFDGRVEAFFAMVHPEDVDRVRSASQAAILYGEPYSVDHRIVRRDGAVRWVHEQADIVRDEAGRPVRMIGTVQDITDRKQLEQQLVLSQKLEAVGRLAGGIAHDFNNLLTAILGYSSLLLSRVEEPFVRQKLDEIRKAGESAAALTRQLLAFSRKQVMVPAVLDLQAVISQLEPMLQRLIGEDISLTTVLDAATGAVKADRSQLEQVIVNLAVNARDAMPRGGRLTLEVGNAELDESYARERPGTKAGRYVMLAVSDTGIGMDSETRNRIFEPFFTTKEMGKGTGLGLATVYGIVKQSGGNIWVYSEPELGTTFKVYLPRVDSAGRTLPVPEGPAALARGSETVLLVEDEDAVRGIASEILTESGYRVLEASHGEEALRVASDHEGTIHLLLSDVVMPEMSGRALAERIVAIHPETKVLFMSGYTDEAVVRHGVLESGTAFIQKPFGPEALASKVREILGRP